MGSLFTEYPFEQGVRHGKIYCIYKLSVTGTEDLQQLNYVSLVYATTRSLV